MPKDKKPIRLIDEQVKRAFSASIVVDPRDYPAPPPPLDPTTIKVFELGPPRPSSDTIVELARRVDNPFARHELDMLAQELETHHQVGNRKTQIADCLARVMFAIGVWRFTCYENVPGFEAITTTTEGEG